MWFHMSGILRGLRQKTGLQWCSRKHARTFPRIWRRLWMCRPCQSRSSAAWPPPAPPTALSARTQHIWHSNHHHTLSSSKPKSKPNNGGLLCRNFKNAVGQPPISACKSYSKNKGEAEYAKENNPWGQCTHFSLYRSLLCIDTFWCLLAL